MAAIQNKNWLLKTLFTVLVITLSSLSGTSNANGWQDESPSSGTTGSEGSDPLIIQPPSGLVSPAPKRSAGFVPFNADEIEVLPEQEAAAQQEYSSPAPIILSTPFGTGQVPETPADRRSASQGIRDFIPSAPIPQSRGMRNGTESQEIQPIIPGRTDLRSLIEGSLKTAKDSGEEKGPEVIRQRYPDGKVQLMKQVAQDDEGNYYNQGDWKLFNRRGQILAEGKFNKGVMDGLWRRWHPAGSGGIFGTKPFNMFKGPFLSTATFKDGELDGIWTLTDTFERKIFDIPYRDGIRDGTATWYYPNAIRMREVVFDQGVISGALRVWSEENRLVQQDEFIEGKKIVRQTSFYRPKQKLEEKFFLDGKLVLKGKDDWWLAQPSGFDVVGEKIQHGPMLSWHVNGQQKMRGQFREGTRIGRFTWWHQNGQKSLQGSYDDEGNKVGNWTWWHSNGIKSISGTYEDNRAAGIWVWRDESGQVTNKENLDEREDENDPSESVVNTDDAQPEEPDSGTGNEPPAASILVEPEDFESIEEMQPYGEGSFDSLPEKNNSDEKPMEEVEANEVDDDAV